MRMGLTGDGALWVVRDCILLLRCAARRVRYMHTMHELRAWTEDSKPDSTGHVPALSKQNLLDF